MKKVPASKAPRETVAFGSTVKRFLSYLAPDRTKMVAIIILMAVYSVSLSAIPILMGQATNIMAAGPGPVGPLATIILEILGIAIILLISGIISQRLLADVAQDAVFRLRRDLFSHMQTLSLSFFDRRPIGELMSRVTNDTQVIEQYLSIGFLETGQAVIMIVVTTIFMLWLSPLLTLFTYVVVAGLLGFSWMITNVSGPAFVLLQKRTGDLNGFTEE
jgi:ABC-type multidrug transport system fused ATPase/permease subunit